MLRHGQHDDDVREYDDVEYLPHAKQKMAVSVARVTFVKRTHLILEANANARTDLLFAALIAVARWL